MRAFQTSNLNEIRNHLCKQYKLFQPVKDEMHQWHWQNTSLSKHMPITENVGLAQFSPKAFFFAEQEDIFRFDGESFKPSGLDSSPFALFGVSACELAAIAYQDQFFREDRLYQNKRRNSLLIGFDCHQVCENGFCPTVNSGPMVNNESADIIVFNVGFKTQSACWWIIVCTEKGENAIQGLPLEAAPEDWEQQRLLQKKNISEEYESPTYLALAIEKINKNGISQTFWHKVAVNCLSCSGCTSVCPTCTCYGTEDNTDSNGDIVRSRFWDSCLYEGFQKEASGQNPSEAAGKRVERFWYHKFSYKFYEQFNRYTCIGCGRCETVCPGVIGVHSMMHRIAEE